MTPSSRGGRSGMQVFQSLIGDWTLSRVLSPDIGTMTGTARFRELEPNLLHYREDGQLELATGHVGQASREYHYCLEDEQIRVCFVEPDTFGRTLHTLRHADISAPPLSAPPP